MSNVIGIALSEPSKLYSVYSETHKILNESHYCLLGRMLTLVDASFSDPEQRKAMKDLVKQEFNDMWNHELRDIILSQFRCIGNIFNDDTFKMDSSPILGNPSIK